MKTDINFLRSKLMNLLEYHDIPISLCECRDYSQSELHVLIHWYQIRVHCANIRSNSWYKTLF